MDTIKGTILITGGSGLIGRLLTRRLLEKGYAVRWLVRSPTAANVSKEVLAYRWDVDKGYIDPAALDGTDVLIHLAGENLAGGRWTAKRKKVLMESRTRSTTLLVNKLKESPGQVKKFLTASAIGYYGDRPGSETMTEESTPGDDFLAEITKNWESAADELLMSGIRVVKVRIGIVLSAQGGALQELARPVRWFAGSPLGSGDQVMSWIHEDDLARIFIHLMENGQSQGAFNAVSPNPVTNRELVQAIARVLHRPVILPPVPAFILRLLLGEMAAMVLSGCRVSGKKLEDTGFEFRFRELAPALADILGKAS